MQSIEELFQSAISGSFSLTELMTALVTALVAGLLISFTYRRTTVIHPTRGFTIALILLPAVVAALIMLIGSDVARAFSLAGAFSIIRFRSSAGDPKEIAFVLFTMAAGLAAGMVLPVYSLTVTVILCAAMFVIHLFMNTKKESSTRDLQITVPEDLDFESALDEVLGTYTSSHTLTRIKSSAMGSLVVLNYSIEMKNEGNIKEFIDQLRIRNGNLNISLNLQDITA